MLNIALPLIDAAIEVGVKRFIPSGWGFGLHSGPGSWQELLIPKYKVRDYLNKKAAEGKITWTTVATGLFYDWAFGLGLFGFDFVENRVGLYDQGDQKIVMTTLASIADSVVGILNNAEQTQNKLVRIHDFFLSHQEIVKVVEGLTGRKCEAYHVSTDDQITSAKAMPPSDTAVGIHALALSWGKAKAAEWDIPDDSELVGLKRKDIKEETAKALRQIKVIP